MGNIVSCKLKNICKTPATEAGSPAAKSDASYKAQGESGDQSTTNEDKTVEKSPRQERCVVRSVSGHSKAPTPVTPLLNAGS